jgi:hypothetical protein
MHAPLGLGDAVRRRVGGDAMWQWSCIDAGGGRESRVGVAELLFSSLGLEAPNPSEPWAEKLGRAREMQDRVVWIDGFAQGDWAAWKEGAIAYARVCKQLPQFGRGVLCCVVEGVGARNLPDSDAALAVHQWRDRLSELDLQIWVAQVIKNIEMNPLERRARRILAGALAAFDPALAAELASLALEKLTCPSDLLRKIAAERGWTGAAAESATWEAGIVDSVDGEKQVHAGVLASSGKQGALQLQARVWQAQVTIVFPLLEQRRLRILTEYRKWLSVPFHKSDGSVVSAIEDLEIVDLQYQLRSHPSTRLSRLLPMMKQARNKLAHMEPLSGFELEDLLRGLGSR